MSDAPPELPAGADQIVVKLDLRRMDPPNPRGDSIPDIGSTFISSNQEFVSALVNVCNLIGFDPHMSIISIESIRDVEIGGGFITLAALAGLQDE